MKPCKQIRRSFIEALYSELNAEEQKNFDSHLELCVKCKRAFRKMKGAMRVMNQRVRVEPDQQFWNGYWERLEDRMQREQHVVVRSRTSSWQSWIYRAAAVLLLIGAGVLLGRFWVPSPTVLTENEPSGVPVMKANLDQRTQQFLGRSEIILLGLVNYDSETDEATGLDMTKQKAVSRNLIHEASYLKRQLADGDDRRLEKLVGDLELILLQIANLEEKEDVPEIELVKSGVDRKGLLLKINLEQMKTGRQRAETMSNGL
jgi:hypothetical protein